MDFANALDEIWRAYGPEAVQEDEFTVMDYARHQGCTYDIARRVLEKAMGAGRVERRWVQGRRLWAYKIVQSP